MVLRIALGALLLFGFAACGSDSSEPEATAASPLAGPWQPTPIALQGPILDAIDRACRASMQPFPEGVRLVVVDARGGGHIQAQFAGANGQEAFCMDMRVNALGQVKAVGGGSMSTGPAGFLALKPLDLETRGTMSSGDPPTSSVTAGRAGNGIAKVVVEIPGKQPIIASLANGWYVASWPAAWPQGSKVAAFDLLGRRVAETTV